MGRYTGILLCTDWDGTIAMQGVALPGNVEAVARFVAEGGRFTVVSGRTPRELTRMTEGLAVNAPMAGLNGTLVFDRTSGEHYHVGHMPSGAKAELTALRHRFDFFRGYHFFTADEHFYYSLDDTMRTFEEFLATVPETGLHKICINTPPPDETGYEASAYLRDTLNDEMGDRYAISRSWYSGVEIQSAEHSKGRAIAHIRALLGDEIKTVICVGDYENDIPMLRAADIGIAIGDGSAQTRAAADRVTVPVRECAIAKIIEEL